VLLCHYSEDLAVLRVMLGFVAFILIVEVTYSVSSGRDMIADFFCLGR